MKSKHTRRGFTLVELIVAAGALVLLSIMVMTFTGFGNRALKSGSDSYDIQSGIRIASETAVQKIRYASAVFTIPDSTFKKGETELTAGWDYFGVEQTTDDKGQAVSQIVRYEYDPSKNAGAGGHNKVVVTQSPPGVTYKIQFSQTNPEEMDKLIKLEIVSYLEGKEYSKVETEIDALNALQVVDKYPGANCTAIAYRSDARPGGGEEKVAVNVVMVLDASGSMDFYMHNGDKANAFEDSRTYQLRVAGRAMVELLKEHPNIELAFVTYSNSANDFSTTVNNKNITVNRIQDFRNVYQDMVVTGECKLKDFFKLYKTDYSDPLCPNWLSSPNTAGTNTGDGIRRAYHMLKNKEALQKKDDPNVKVQNYIIVMTDGESNFRTTKNNVNYSGDGVAPTFVNSGGAEYANQMAAMCVDDFTRYFVGLAGNRDDVYLRNLQKALQCSEEQYYVPKTGDEVKLAFETIAEAIVTDTWHLTGPDI